MTESKSNPSHWIRSWLERQRAELQRFTEAAAASDVASARMSELRGSWLDGLGAWQTGWVAATLAADGAMPGFSSLLAGLPVFGSAQERTQIWRELSAAAAECRKLQQEFCAVLAQVQSDALSMLETRVRERDAANAAIGTQRELYDLWIECGEQVYSQVAHSEAFCRLQAQLGNATLRLRARQQALIEETLKQFDLPTRSELNTVHRQLRELRARVTTLEAQVAGVSRSESK